MSSGAPGALAWLRAFAIPAATQHVPGSQGYSPFCISLRTHVFACAQISRAHRPGAAPCWRVVGADRRARGEAPFDAKDPEKISERSRAPSCASRSLRGAAFWRGDGRGPHLRQELGAQLLTMVLNSRGLSQWGSGMRLMPRPAHPSTVRVLYVGDCGGLEALTFSIMVLPASSV